MKKVYRQIGQTWVDFRPDSVLWSGEFHKSDHYNKAIEQAKYGIERYVNANKTMLSLMGEGGYINGYAMRQLIYANACIAPVVNRLQTDGRHYYKNVIMNKLKEALAPEYAALPEFIRTVYSLDEIAYKYYSEITEDLDLTNQINKSATAFFYQKLRNYIDTII